MPPESARVTWTEVERQEHDAIRRRRGLAAGADVRPDLSGLAISGGGIRSATFALGVLEALKRAGRLDRFDYLSTVSGGGYIGAWLSANARRHPGWLDAAADWRESIGHLRRYSNYLSPRVGFFSADTWTMATIWLRNTLLIQITVLLAIACLLVVPRYLYEVFLHWPKAGTWRWASVVLYVLGAVGIAGNQLRTTSPSEPWILKARSWPVAGLAAAGVLVMTWRFAIARAFSPFEGGIVSYASALPIAGLLIAAGFLLQPVAVKVIARFWFRAETAPQSVNFTQFWAQAVAVVPLICAATLVAAVLWAESTGESGSQGLAALASYGGFLRGAPAYWPFPLAIVGVSLWMFAVTSVDRRHWRAWVVACLAPLPALLVFHAVLCAVMVVLHGWAASPATGAWRAFVWGPPMVSAAFALSLITLVGMLGRASTDGAREWWSRLGAWLGIYSAAWMAVTVAAVYAPDLARWVLDRDTWAKAMGGGGWLGAVLAGLFAGKSDATDGAAVRSTTERVLEVAASAAPFVFIGGVVVAVSYGLDQVLASMAFAGWSSVPTLHHAHHARLLTAVHMVGGGCLGALLVLAARVDINVFSLNAFYRHRLVRCYLGASRVAPGERQPQNFTGFDEDDDLHLTALAPADRPPTGPLHLVNCALNLGGSSDLALHTRHGASFTLSPVFAGSAYDSRAQTGEVDEVGFIPTAAYAGSPTLGQAIAVSGAAASPNMGYHTSPVVAFLLTLFNVRLGWWFPNPRGAATAQPSPWFSLRYLVFELFGGAHDRSPFLMVSDGGHFENLAAYELVRRRCRRIVVSDGECDPTMAFEGLGTLIRMCEVDFRARIVIDVTPLAVDPATGVSQASAASGLVHYADGTTGIFVYLKAAMTAGADTAVRQYKAAHRLFPHESTGDQFYGEDQFESYRRLGRHVADDAMDRGLIPA